MHPTPPELSSLLGAADGAAFEAAWSRFVDAHTPLILSVARSLGGDRDAVMDR